MGLVTNHVHFTNIDACYLNIIFREIDTEIKVYKILSVTNLLPSPVRGVGGAWRRRCAHAAS